MSAIKILLADDQAMIREGLRLILAGEPDFDVVGEAADGEEAIDQAVRLRPDVILMDVQMPKVDGLEATRRLAERLGTLGRAGSTGTCIVILTTFDLDEYLFEALRAGASGFLVKNAPAEELIRAVRIVASGDALLSPAVTGRVIAGFVQRGPTRITASRLDPLSPREREVLVLVTSGASNAEIAAALFLSEATVKTHVGSILAKLGLRDRVAAVIVGYEAGLANRPTG